MLAVRIIPLSKSLKRYQSHLPKKIRRRRVASVVERRVQLQSRHSSLLPRLSLSQMRPSRSLKNQLLPMNPISKSQLHQIGKLQPARELHLVKRKAKAAFQRKSLRWNKSKKSLKSKNKSINSKTKQTKTMKRLMISTIS